jgi:hypothetical protein
MKLACTALCLALVATLSAQERKLSRKQVPPAVLAAFQKAYPRAVIKGTLEEKKDGKTFIEVESLDGKISRDLLYNVDGTVAEMEESMAVADLPEAVKTAVAAKYPKGRILKAEKATAGAAITYCLQVRAGKNTVSVSVDPAGKITEEAKAANEKEDDEKGEKKVKAVKK